MDVIRQKKNLRVFKFVHSVTDSNHNKERYIILAKELHIMLTTSKEAGYTVAEKKHIKLRERIFTLLLS